MARCTQIYNDITFYFVLFARFAVRIALSHTKLIRVKFCNQLGTFFVNGEWVSSPFVTKSGHADNPATFVPCVTVLQQSNCGVRKTAVQQSERIRQFLIDGRSGNVTDALREALGKRKEGLGQRPGSFTEAPDGSNATEDLNRLKLPGAYRPTVELPRTLHPWSSVG